MRLLIALTAILITCTSLHAECKTCTKAREKQIKNSVKYPAPPASPVPRRTEQNLYKKFPLRKIQTADRIASYPVIVYPEKTVWLRLSNTDVNRIVCTKGEITYVFTSREKGVVTEIKGDELFVKFKSLLDPDTGSIKRIKTPTEFYIRCAGETYSFIAKPRAIPTRTIYLESKKELVKPPENLLSKMSLDSAISQVIRSVFLSRVPPSWQTLKNTRPISITRVIDKTHITITCTRTYRIPGVPVLVRVLSLSSDKPVQISEKLLLHPSFRYLVDSRIARDQMINMIRALKQIPSSITYNLMLSSVFAFTISLSFSIGYNIFAFLICLSLR